MAEVIGITQRKRHDTNQPDQLDRKRRCRRIGNRQSAIGNRQSAIGNRQSAIGNRQSAIGNRQSAIGNRQSAIGNRQSAIPLLCLIFCAALLTSGSQNATAANASVSVIPAQAGINNPLVIPAQTGIQTQTQPRHSRAEGAGIQHSRESAPALAGVKAGIQLRVLPLQLLDNRYRDYVGFPPLLRSGENDGKSFSNFYRASQIKLFSALDNALSQKAEDTLSEFAAVKKAEVNFQTPLGNRQGQLGINLIGAFAEKHNNAFGWQVRVYGGEKSSKGANAGIFYRRFNGDILFGGNVFLDYEDNDLGTFSRYSIGGEAQNKYGSFAANYYVPITDEKRKDGGVIFSRKGYDAKLRLNIPNAKFLKAAIDYYNFGEEHGAESDDGFRYGAEAHLIPGLRLGLFYDDGGEELGGEVSYIHTIGEVQQSQTTNEQWTPDLFAAVSREHSQRIVSVKMVSVNVDNSPSYQSAVNQVEFGTAATLGAVNIPAGFAASAMISAISPPTGFMINGNNLIWQPAALGSLTLSIVVSDTAMPPSQTATLLITAASYQVQASVNAVLRLMDTDINVLVSTTNKLLVTLPPANTTRPFVLTILFQLIAHHVEVLTIITDVNNRAIVGMAQFPAQFFAGPLPNSITLTIIESSEERMTVFAQAVMPFDMPGFSPLSFPLMAELALAKNLRNALTIPPHFPFIRRKGFAANPPPLIF